MYLFVKLKEVIEGELEAKFLYFTKRNLMKRSFLNKYEKLKIIIFALPCIKNKVYVSFEFFGNI